MLNAFKNWIQQSNWFQTVELDPMDEPTTEDIALDDLPDGPVAVVVLVDGTMYEVTPVEGEEFSEKIDSILHAMDTDTVFELVGQTEEGRVFSEFLRGSRVAHLFVV